MTGEELGIELLKRMSEVQSGKKLKNPSTADITMLSQQLTKEEYDNFYYMTQIGNLIVNLSKQEISYVLKKQYKIGQPFGKYFIDKGIMSASELQKNLTNFHYHNMFVSGTP